MPFIVKLEDHRFDVEDLPLERWVTIQKATGKTWVEVLSSGNLLGDADVAIHVVRQVAEHLGVTPPVLSVKSLLDTVTFEKADNLPDQFVEGIPDPKASATAAATT